METRRKPSPEDLQRMHAEAEAKVTTFSYSKPSESIATGKGRVDLFRTDRIRGLVQIVKKNGGENNLHYHTNSDSMWFVIKGRVRFYGPDDHVIGEFGPMEGTISPAYSRYWFENIGDGDLEIMQVAALHERSDSTGRTDVTPQRYKIGSSERFSAVKN